MVDYPYSSILLCSIILIVFGGDCLQDRKQENSIGSDTGHYSDILRQPITHPIILSSERITVMMAIQRMFIEPTTIIRTNKAQQ